MPMIDVYAPADLFPAGSDRELAEELTSAVLRAEGVTTPAAAHLANRSSVFGSEYKTPIPARERLWSR